MKPLEEITCMCLMVFSMVKAYDIRGTKQIPLTLQKITKVAPPGNNQMMQLTFDVVPEIGVVSIENIILAVMTDKSERIYKNVDVQEIPAGKTTSISYQISSESLTNVNIIIAAHDADSNTLAFLWQGLTLTAISSTMTKVGAPGQKNTLRVATETDVTLNDNECLVASNPCYFLDFKFDDPLEVCTKASDESGVVTDILICDDTLSIDESSDISDVTKIVLTSSAGPSTMSITADYKIANRMEISFITGEISPYFECIVYNSECSGEITEDIPVDTFGVLMVALDDSGQVIESNQMDFEDYKTEVQSLAAGLIEVRWNAKSKSTHKITIVPEDVVPKKEVPYEEISLECGKDMNAYCKAYFVNLDLAPYTVSVEKEDGDTNIVAATIDLSTTDTVPILIITKFTEILPSTQNEDTNFIVTVKSAIDPIPKINKIVLSIINKLDDTKASEIIYISPGDITIGTDEQDLVFTIDKSLLLAGKNSHLVITAHGAEDNDLAMAVAMVNPDFKEIIPPSVDEVGKIPTWIRVMTGDMELEVNGILCEQNVQKYFQKEETFTSPVLLCRDAGENLDELQTQMKQCDQTHDITTPPELTSLSRVELMYPPTEVRINTTMEIKADYLEESKSMEARIHVGDKIKVSSLCASLTGDANPKTCLLDSLITKDELVDLKFSILVVALSKEGKVTESTSIEFENYQSDGYFLLDDIAAVTWNTTKDVKFRITMNKVDDTKEEVHEIQCEPTAEDPDPDCMIFFTDLTIGKDYVAHVKKAGADDLNIVGVSVPQYSGE